MTKNQQENSREDLEPENNEEENQEQQQQEDNGEDVVKIPRKDFENLKRNLAKANKSDEKRRKELEAYSRYGSPEELAELVERAETVGENGGMDDEAINKKLEKQRKELERKFQGEIQTREEQLAQMQKKIEETVLLSQARETIAKFDGVPDLLLGAVRERTKVVEQNGSYRVAVVDEEGDFAFNNSGEYMTLEDYIKSLREHEVYGMAFKAPQQKGAGVRSQNEGGAKKGSPSHGLSKRTMTVEQKAAFIEEHGFEEYNKIQP